MKVLNQLKMQISAKSSNESFARACVGAFVAQLDPLVEDLADLKTAVSEAVTNCIVHAYKDCSGDIYITVKILSENKVCVKIRDKGCGIADVKRAREPLFTTGGEERAGLGFAVIEAFTDKLRVTSHVGVGTTVTFYKTLEKK